MVTKLVKKETEGKEAERMEKENRQRRKRNKKDIRNAFVMLCVTIAMMSTATFAWFTMTDSPTVQGLKMTAAATGGLELKYGNEDWNSSITVDSATKSLSPVSIMGSTDKFGSPVYTNGIVTTVQEISDSGELEKCVAIYEYQIRAVGATASSPVKVGLLGGDGAGSNPTGTFIVRSNANSASQQAAYAIRVGFKIDNNWIIYEPHADQTTGGTKAVNQYNGPTSTVKQNSNGNFEGGSNVSKDIFTLSDTNAHAIKMYVWIEGTDDQCVNELQTDELKGQIQFTVIK